MSRARAAAAAALLAAALAPVTASAAGPSCRVVMDPRAVNTPLGQIQVPYYYVYCYPDEVPA